MILGEHYSSASRHRHWFFWIGIVARIGNGRGWFVLTLNRVTCRVGCFCALEPSLELILVRHGLPERIELASGRADPALSDVGGEQARKVGAWLGRETIDAIYASPLRRAVETAEPLASGLGLPPVIHESVAEYDRGASHYIPMEELKREDYPAWKAFVDGGYAEEVDMAEFAMRVSDGMEEIIRANAGRRVAVFCHGGVVNVWTARVLGMPPSLFINVDYGSISRFLCASTGERNVRSLNETGHLDAMRGG